MRRDQELEKQILDYIKKHEFISTHELANKDHLNRRYATVWNRVQDLLRKKQLIKVQFDCYALNFKKQKVPLYIETVNTKSGKLVTADYFKNHRNLAKLRLEESETKGKDAMRQKSENSKKKYLDLLEWKVPENKQELVNKIIMLNNECEKLWECLLSKASK